MTWHPTPEGIYLLDRKVDIYDTTLRDGAQTEGVSFSTEDKLEVLRRLDEFGIDFVEGGYPGSNLKDQAFFAKARGLRLSTAKLVAFGMTRKTGIEAADDPNLRALVDTGTEWVCIFGKSWDMQVEKALKVSQQENLRMIADSISFLRREGRKVIYDAEHFFDGYKGNQKYCLKTIQTAVDAGAERICLCDTNGGTFPVEVGEATRKVVAMINRPVGIHAHNDCELAVANSLAAVEAGADMVQGTINGLGERCGNANLCSIMPDLFLKRTARGSVKDLSRLTALSAFVSEIANISPDPHLPFVGRSAFAHKAGIHVSAVMRDSRTYEHLTPELVGNQRRILVSELAGNSSIVAKAKELGVDIGQGKDILEALKKLEAEGFQFEAAEASLELLIRRLRNEWAPPFRLEGFRVFADVTGESMISEASVRVYDENGVLEHTAADGNGPVNALDRAVRKALERFYPVLREVRLVDYKVRVIDSKDATASKVRVLIRSTDGKDAWNTIGVSGNIIEASLMALLDSIEYKLMKSGVRSG